MGRAHRVQPVHLAVRRLIWGARPYVPGAALVVAGLVSIAPVAGATFAGGDGDIAFASICSNTIGQAVYSVSPIGSPPPTYSCPGGSGAAYTQRSAGSADSMPFFDATGSVMYFASNRNGNFAIFEVSYPSTVSGSPGTQTDGATQLTSPVASNDYAPVVSPDGSTLAFLRCTTTSCALYKKSPVSSGSPVAVTTVVPPLAPDSVSGAASRPEFDPVDDTKVSYVGTDDHIHIVNITTSSDTDLSAASGIPSGDIDEYPDWSPDGTTIVFDTNQAPSGDLSATGTHFVWTITVATSVRQALWPAADPGKEIEPIFSPAWTSVGGGEYAWTVLGAGSNIQLDAGTSVNRPADLVNLTSNRSNNSQPAWDPTAPGAQAPEAPSVLLLPAAGAVVGGAGWLLLATRRKRVARL
jgi:hypothetical protein